MNWMHIKIAQTMKPIFISIYHNWTQMNTNHPITPKIYWSAMTILLRGLGPSLFFLATKFLFLIISIWFLLLICIIASSSTNLLINTSSFNDFPLNTTLLLPLPSMLNLPFTNSSPLGYVLLLLGGTLWLNTSLYEDIGAHRHTLSEVHFLNLLLLEDLLLQKIEEDLLVLVCLHGVSASSIAFWYHLSFLIS